MSLVNLSSIQNHQKWVVANSQITCVAKKSGKIQNLIDFNAVVKFTLNEIRGKNVPYPVLYVENLSLKYTHIQTAIAKQSLITRCFLKIVLAIYGFDRNYKELVKTTQTLKSLASKQIETTHPKEIDTATKPIEAPPQVFGKTIAGAGFINSGNSCFIASALQCLNCMPELLPKDIDKERLKSESETDNQFEERKQAARIILKLLEKINQGQTCTRDEILVIRQLLHHHNPEIPEGDIPGESKEALQAFFEIFNISPLTITVINKKNGSRHSRNESSLGTQIDKTAEESSYPGLLRGFEPSSDGSYLYKSQEVVDRTTHKAPLYVPVFIERQDDTAVALPKTMSLMNLKDDKYELIACKNSIGGHAVAFRKSNDKWIKYNDAEVKEVADEEAIRDMEKGCGILIYRKKERDVSVP